MLLPDDVEVTSTIGTNVCSTLDGQADLCPCPLPYSLLARPLALLRVGVGGSCSSCHEMRWDVILHRAERNVERC